MLVGQPHGSLALMCWLQGDLNVRSREDLHVAE
jgi:hypothetical protein